MNRTERRLAIALELQACGKRRAEDLTATFEVGCDEKATSPSKLFCRIDERRTPE